MLDDELIPQPMALESNSADCIWSALSSVPSALWGAISGEPSRAFWMASVNLGSGHHKANLKLLAEVEDRAPANVITPHGLRKQHAAGLCITAVAKYLNFLCPLFCMAKLFRQDTYSKRFQEGVRKAALANLLWVRADEQPDWRPDPANLAYAWSILQFACYSRDLRTMTDAEDQAAHYAMDKLRRGRGEALLDVCPGDWRRKEIVHWRKGCCGSVESACGWLWSTRDPESQ